MVPAGRITYTQSKFLHEFQTFLALFNAVLERPPDQPTEYTYIPCLKYLTIFNDNLRVCTYVPFKCELNWVRPRLLLRTS